MVHLTAQAAVFDFGKNLPSGQDLHNHPVGQADDGAPFQTLLSLVNTDLIRTGGLIAPDLPLFYHQMIHSAPGAFNGVFPVLA